MKNQILEWSLMRSIVEQVCRRARIFSPAIASVVLAIAVFAGGANGAHRLLGQEDATRLGLKRAWFTQVRLDAGRNRVERAVLEGDRLTVLTSAGIVQEIDALTGQTYWVAPIGKENYPSLGP